MTVLVTGGSGFLGSHVAEQLALARRPVRALVRKTSDTSFLRTLENVELVYGAVEDADSLTDAVAGVDAIVHSAGLVKARSTDEFYRVNAGGTENLLQAALKTRSTLRRFVLVSSQAVMGPSDAQGTPVRPDATPNPVTRYARSKLAAEHAALALKNELPITIIRPPAIYGPRDREFLAFFKAVKFGILAYMGSADNKLSIIYGPDAASACIAAIDSNVESGSTFFIDDGAVYTATDLAHAIEAALSKRALVRFALPRGLIRTIAAATEAYGKAVDRAVILTRDKCTELFAQWVGDSSGTREALGWEPKVDFEEGARITAAWYKREGWL
jgi:nucleoside-diphosphate-sugar epimerase